MALVGDVLVASVTWVFEERALPVNITDGLSVVVDLIKSIAFTVNTRLSGRRGRVGVEMAKLGLLLHLVSIKASARNCGYSV